ncbi:46 kDa FK506-binding nuclear protein-like [Cloeon dipterum]|uniref:46 kDa FK506-binding nuclear protein-like n=1 Tax=Cloeon dipterum TaxID=197152 RepID=UPI00321FDBDC
MAYHSLGFCGFWGLTLDSGLKYNQIVGRSFHVTMAALDLGVDSDSKVTLMAHRTKHQASNSGRKNFILGTLSKKTGKLQQVLDLKFFNGEKIRLALVGKGRVHLTGFLLPKQGKAKKPDPIIEHTKAESNRDFEKRLILIMKKRKQIRKNAKNEARQKKQSLQSIDDDTDSINSVDKKKRDNLLLRLAAIRKRCLKPGAKKWQVDNGDSENEDKDNASSGDEDQEMDSSEENYDKESENDSNESDGEDEAQTEDEEEPPKKKQKPISPV